MTILDDRTNILAWDFGSKPWVARRRTKAISLALERCTFDFDKYLLPAMRAKNVATVGLRYETGMGGEWDDEKYEIILSADYGTRRWPDPRGTDQAGIFLHEMGHVVDTFVLTQNNENRRAISNAFCSTDHTWWDNLHKYSIGEAFGDAFAAMYGGGLMPWDNIWGHHKLTPKVEAVIKGILEEVP